MRASPGAIVTPGACVTGVKTCLPLSLTKNTERHLIHRSLFPPEKRMLDQRKYIYVHIPTSSSLQHCLGDADIPSQLQKAPGDTDSSYLFIRYPASIAASTTNTVVAPSPTSLAVSPVDPSAFIFFHSLNILGLPEAYLPHVPAAEATLSPSLPHQVIEALWSWAPATKSVPKAAA